MISAHVLFRAFLLNMFVIGDRALTQHSGMTRPTLKHWYINTALQNKIDNCLNSQFLFKTLQKYECFSIFNVNCEWRKIHSKVIQGSNIVLLTQCTAITKEISTQTRIKVKHGFKNDNYIIAHLTKVSIAIRLKTATKSKLRNKNANVFGKGLCDLNAFKTMISCIL